MKFTVHHNIEQVDKRAFLDIFLESSQENAVSWYPNLPCEAALKKYEEEFWTYMQETFWNEQGILALLHRDGTCVSALRVYPRSENVFLFEALETKPDERQHGFGSEILQNAICYLEKTYGRITVLSYTGKSNTASRLTHLAAGMTCVCDYWQDENGKKNPTQVTFRYQSKEP